MFAWAHIMTKKNVQNPPKTLNLEFLVNFDPFIINQKKMSTDSICSYEYFGIKILKIG